MKYAATRFCQWFFLFIFASLLVGPTKQALAQGTQGAIAGTVTDPSGAVLKGAQVSIPARDHPVKTLTNRIRRIDNCCWMTAISREVQA